MRILLVEDDELVAAGLREALGEAGHEMDHLPSAATAPTALSHGMHDLAIFDIGLPGLDGLSLLRRVREDGLTLPVLMLTARDGLSDRVTGLNDGADDYLTKPFLLPELMARVNALLRRSKSVATSLLSVGPLTLNLATHTASLHGQALSLTGRERSLLEALMLDAPKVVAKRKLADSLSCWDKELTDNAVEIYVSRLRGKLTGSGLALRTVRGIGYRLEADACVPPV